MFEESILISILKCLIKLFVNYNFTRAKSMIVEFYKRTLFRKFCFKSKMQAQSTLFKILIGVIFVILQNYNFKQT